MYELLGYMSDPGSYYTCCESPDLIALFDTKELARAYVKKARRKNPSLNSHYPFKKSSLLANYQFVEIEEHIPYPDVPVNPTV